MGGWQELHLRLAVHEVIIGLQRDRPRHMQLIGEVADVRQLPAAHVGDAPLADLALPDQGAIGLDHALPTHSGVGNVNVVEVDAVGAEPLQAGLDCPHHVGARLSAAVGTLVERIAALGRQDPAMPLRLDGAADHFLRHALGIGVGRVDEIDAVLEGMIDDASRGGLVRLSPKQHGAEAELRHARAAGAEDAGGERHGGVQTRQSSVVSRQ